MPRWSRDDPNVICYDDDATWARLEPYLKSFPPWGGDLAKLVEPSADKFVHFVICKVGGEGKTNFSDWMMFRKMAMCFYALFQLRCVLKPSGKIPPYHAYVVDLTCAETVDIARSKSKRTRFYNDVFRLFERDHSSVVVFWRRDPDPDLLARANCKIWSIVDGALRPLDRGRD